MLLGLQQLFTSPKALELRNKADQGLDLALLGDVENMEGFGEELLAVLQEMNPEEAKAQLELVKSQVQQANNFELVSPEKGEIISQELAQKSTQSKDSPILEQVLENDGNKKTESSLKQLFSQFTSKQAPVAPKNVERSPAIDFSPENIDKQLLNFEDFNQQKNAVKKTAPQVSYPGLESKKELDLKSTEVVKALPTESSVGNGNLQNSAHFILNTLVDSQPSSNELNLNSVKAPVATAPVFDAAQIKTADANVIIGQITDYIIQAKAAQEPTVNFKMNHQDLGQLDITVAKAVNSADAVAINIGASAAEGKQFFTQNLKELSTHLASVGIQVSDIKIESSAQT
ncbi:MAG: hypothetical protein WDA09_09860, partial [Bacteriovoracaceae bacterium]